jgi:hypothetical protein
MSGQATFFSFPGGTADLTMTLPTRQQLHQAIETYLQQAYGGGEPPPQVLDRLPGPDQDLADWFASDAVERDPADADPDTVRSVAVRLGNAVYPHMKLRMSRPPNDALFLFSVDSHDAVLQAQPGTPDQAMLEELKQHNADLGSRITARWEALGLPTERNYLRHKIEQTRRRDVSQQKPRDASADEG